MRRLQVVRSNRSARSGRFPAMAARAWRGVLAASVIFVTLATPAQATIRTGSGARPRRRQQRPGGHRPGPDGGARRRRRARGARGPAAAAPASGAWRARPASGRSGPSGCGAPYALFTGSISAGVAVFQRETATSASDLKPATLSVEGNVVALVAERRDARGAVRLRAGGDLRRTATVGQPLRRVRRADRAGARGRAGADADADAGGDARAGDDPAARARHRPPPPHRRCRCPRQAKLTVSLERRAVDDPPQPDADAQAQRHQRRLQALEQGQRSASARRAGCPCAGWRRCRRSSPPRSGPSSCA